MSDFFADLTRHDIQRSLENLTITYLVRLFAEFEAILRDHLISIGLRLSSETTSFRLIDSAYRQYRTTISPILYQRVHNIRTIRNRMAHQNEPDMGISIAIEAVLADLSRFVAKLTESPVG